jgi:xylulokinase
MAYMMGIDVGTTGTRAIIVRPDGHIVGAATGDHQPMKMAKPGWAEQEPEDWWRATLVAVRGALDQAQLKGSDIDAVGFSGQMHGVVLMDSTMRLDHLKGGGGALDPARLQSRPHRLQRSQAALDSR